MTRRIENLRRAKRARTASSRQMAHEASPGRRTIDLKCMRHEAPWALAGGI